MVALAGANDSTPTLAAKLAINTLMFIIMKRWPVYFRARRRRKELGIRIALRWSCVNFSAEKDSYGDDDTST